MWSASHLVLTRAFTAAPEHAGRRRLLSPLLCLVFSPMRSTTHKALLLMQQGPKYPSVASPQMGSSSKDPNWWETESLPLGVPSSTSVHVNASALPLVYLECDLLETAVLMNCKIMGSDH